MSKPTLPPEEKRLKHLNAALRAFRPITRETNQAWLLEKSCKMLVEVRGYIVAWIALTDKQGKVFKVCQAGMEKDFPPIENILKNKKEINCIDEALKQPGTVIADSESEICNGCPILNYHTDGHGLSIRLAYRDQIFGCLTVYSDRALSGNSAELNFFSEVAEDISYALYGIVQEKRRKKAESELHRNEARYRHLFENSSSGVAVYQAIENGNDFIIKDINKKAEEIEQINRKDVVGHRLTEIFPGVRDLGLFKILQRVMETGETEYFPESLYKDSRDPGSWRENWVYRLPGGEIVAVYNDITERKNSQQTLQESALRHRAIFSNSPDAILLADPETERIIDANPAASTLLKMPLEKLIGLKQGELHPPETRESAKTKFNQLLKNGQTKKFTTLTEDVVIRTDGVKIPVEITAQIVPLQGKRILQGVFRDISKRKEHEDILKSLFRVAPIGIGLVGPDREILSINEKICEMTGYDESELIGQNAAMLYPTKLDYDMVGKTKYKQIRDKGTGVVESRWQTKNGKIINVLISSTPLDISDLSKGTTFTALNITEQKKIEAALKDSENKYRTIFESASVALLIADFDGTIKDVNKAFCTVYGYKKDDVIKKMNIEKLIHPDYRNVLDEFISSLKNKGFFSGETIDVRKDGALINIDVRGSVITFEGQQFMLAILQDITEWKLAEDKIRRLSQAVEQSPASIMITSLSGKIEYVNPKFTEITGYSFIEARGQNPRILKSGNTSNKEYQELWRTISSGKIWEGELHNKTKTGEFFWEKATIAPIFNKKGDITNFLAVKKDITTQKQLEEQLQQSQKMEAIGMLAGGIAHDFNNLLTIINGYGSIILSELEPNDNQFERIQEIILAGKKAETLTRQLLAFSRKQVLKPEILNINNLIKNMEKMLRRIIGEHIDLFTIFDDQLDNVKIDKGQFEQVMMNLSVNARDAIQKGGILTFETQNKYIDKTLSEKYEAVKPGSYVMVTITDNGVGMNKEICDRIFDPFFTTKETGKGTGLGLSTVYGIIKQSGGHIEVYSEPRKGTSFHINLPALKESASNKIKKAESRNAFKGTETILIVEDEEAVRNMNALALSRLGYRILKAANGEEAINIIENSEHPVDLVLTDIIMPKMSGYELSKKIYKNHPGIKILFISGYTNNTFGESDTKIDFIQKPASIHEISQKIREELDRN